MSTAAADSLSAAGFADHALLAYWNGDGEETADRTIVRGHDAIEVALAGWSEAETLVSVRDGRDFFLEGRLAGGDTFVASLQLDEAGRVERALTFHCPAVEPPPANGSSRQKPAGSARAVLDRYFATLTAGDFAEAVACFSKDCLYSHPPYSEGAERAEFRGRDELLAGFQGVRGARPSRLPQIIRCVQNGADCFIEGVVDGDPPRGSFVSSVSLDADGLIHRYVAFYTESRVPRL
jgi:SnoaL-like protein